MIYFIECETSSLVKVGFTNRFLEHRISSLQTGSPFPLRCIATFDGGKPTERSVHSALQLFARQGEWFDGEAARAFIKDAKAMSLGAAVEKWALDRDRQIESRRAAASAAVPALFDCIDAALHDLAKKRGPAAASMAIGCKRLPQRPGRIELHALANLCGLLPERGQKIMQLAAKLAGEPIR